MPRRPKAAQPSTTTENPKPVAKDGKESPIPPPQAKRGRKPAVGKAADSTIAAQKGDPQTAAADKDEADAAPAPKQRKTRAKAQPPPPQRASERDGRNLHPGHQAGVQPNARRSSKEVAAEREAERREAEEILRKAEEAKKILAALNMEEEMQRMAAMRKRQRATEDESSEGEGFDFDAIEVDESESESEPEVIKKVTKAKSKVKKGGVRGDIDAMTEDLRRGDDGERKKKKAKVDSIQTQTMKSGSLDIVPKKYTDAGLRANLKGKPTAKDGERVIGGLDDEDADGERPEGYQKVGAATKPQFPAKLERDITRKNEMAAMEVEACNELPKKSTRKKNAKNTPSPGQQPIEKTGAMAPDATDKKDKKSDPTNSFLEDARWKTAFLPSITHAFYISSEPFKHFSPNSPVFLQTIQEVFNSSFSDVSYEISAKSIIVTMAYNRIKLKRSFIASDALDEVQKFFNSSDYTGKKDKIKEYAVWALKGDGPGYNAKPTPSDCKVKAGVADYIEPDGTFQSSIMTMLARKYIKHANDSVHEPAISCKHPPKGLYALIAAAVERAFGAYHKGVYKKPDAFSNDNNGSAIAFFKKKGDNISERRWKVILGDLQKELGDNDESEGEGDLSIMSVYREAFYIPKSPVKAQTA